MLDDISSLPFEVSAAFTYFFDVFHDGATFHDISFLGYRSLNRLYKQNSVLLSRSSGCH